MGNNLDTNTILALAYIGGMGVTLHRLLHHWKAFWSDSSEIDVPQLATMTALFLFTPLGILLQGLAQFLVASAMGQHIFGLSYSLYFIHVDRSFGSPEDEWWIALAGNSATYILGIVALVPAVLAKGIRRPLRLILLDIGLLELGWTLVCRPLMEFSAGWSGDWATMYAFNFPLASGIVLGIHLLSLILFMVFLVRNPGVHQLQFRTSETTTNH